MIRRLPLTVACAALAAVLASGCSTFSRNGSAAEVNGHDLKISELDDLAAGFTAITGDAQYSTDENGDFDGPALRSVISRWVAIYAMVDGLAADGYTLDQAGRDAARSELEGSNPAQWAALNASTQQLLVDYRASISALANETDKPSDDTIGKIYLAGVRTSGVLCIRVIFADNEQIADDVAAQLAAGQTFADVADSVNPTDAPTGEGGVLIDGESGQECVLATDVPPAVVDAIADLPIGAASEVIPLTTDQRVFIQQRELSEVTDDLRTTLQLNAEVLSTVRYAAGADVFVDSRYGMWDANTAQVVPTQ